MAMIHDRMPVILPQEALADWLNPHYSGSAILSAALTSMSFHAC
ncbi:MAG: SOS response-associated peptidase family protein [Faecousia sp.]